MASVLSGPVTLPLVRNAVAAAYAQASAGEGSNPKRKMAEEWLRSFQRRPEAWSIAHQLLEDKNATPHELFTAAGTLHTKVSRDFRELNADAIAVLRSTLMKHVVRLAQGASFVRKRLCLAVAALAVQSTAWTNVVPDLVTQLDKPSSVLALLDVLVSLPQEADSSRVHVDHRARRNFRDELDKFACNVIILMINKLPTVGANTTLMGQLVEVVTVWVRHCRISPADVIRTNIIPTAFQALSVDALFETATPLVVELLERYTHPQRDKEVMFALIGQLMPLVPKYQAAKRDGDCDVEREYVRMFAAMGYSYVDLILGSEELNQIKLVDLMVECTDTPESISVRPEICSSALEFWFRLVDKFNKMKSKTLKRQRRVMLVPAFTKLVNVLLRIARFPDDFATLPQDVQHDFNHDFRGDVADLFKDACTMIRSSTTVAFIAGVLDREVPQFTASKGAGVGGVGTWQTIEACLFALKCISNRVGSDESANILRVLTFIPTLPEIVPVWATAIDLVGRYAGWLKRHEAQRNAVLTVVVKYLSVPDLRSHAADALNEVFQACSKQLGQSVFAVHEHVKTLPQKDAVAILEGLCCVASELPYEECVKAQRQIALPMVTTLQCFVANPAEAAAKAAEAAASGGAKPASIEGAGIDAVCDALVKLTCVVRYITPEVDAGRAHPSVATLQLLFNILQRVAATFAKQDRIVEKLTRLYKHAIRSTKAHFIPLVKSLCSHLVTQYNVAPHAGWLYVASTVVSFYSSSHEGGIAMIDYVVELVKTLTNRSFALFRGGLPTFVQNPDIVEDLFRLLCRALEEAPERFVPLPCMALALKCATVGLELEHKEANRSILVFVENFLLLGVSEHNRDETRANRLKRLVGPVLAAEGPVLFTAVMRAIMGKLPRSRIDDSDGSLACVMWALRRLDDGLFRAWVQGAMRTVIPEATISAQVQASFFNDMTSAPTMERFTDVLLDLSEEGYQMRV